MSEDRGTLQRRGEDIIMVLDLKSFLTIVIMTKAHIHCVQN